MRLGLWFGIARATEKQLPCIAQRIAGRQGRSDGGNHRHQPGEAEKRDFQRFVQHHFFRNEAAERWNARHGTRSNGGDEGGDRHGLGKPAQPADIAGAGFMVHDAGGHEQCGLERGMVQNVQHRGNRRHLDGEAEQHHQQPQLADRGIGQNAFQIVPEQRGPCTEQHGEQPDAGDDTGIEFGPRKHRPQAREQKHAGFHHGGGVQIGAHRRGRGHGVRQPEMERELRGFGKAADQDQDQDHRIKR